METINGIPTFELSPQERDLLFLLVRGCTAAQAAQDLGIDPQAAEKMLRHLQERCGVSARRALIARALIQCWV